VQLWGPLCRPPILHNCTEFTGDFLAANEKDGWEANKFTNRPNHLVNGRIMPMLKRLLTVGSESIIKADGNDKNDNDEFTLFLTLLFGKDHSDAICRAQDGVASTVSIRQFDGAYGRAAQFRWWISRR
jgi:hypothetical protein